MTQLILYTSEDGQSRVQLRAHRGTVWLSQRQMAELFDVSPENIGLYLKNIYADGELQRAATAEESPVVQTEGGRENVVQILAVNGFPLLSGAGSVSYTCMEQYIVPISPNYEQRRKSEEAQAADAQNEVELKALKNRIKDHKE